MFLIAIKPFLKECIPYCRNSNSRPFRPLKGKPKFNTNTRTVVKVVFGCSALVSPLGDGRGEPGANKENFYVCDNLACTIFKAAL